MDRDQYTELKAMLLNDPGFRRMVLDVLKEDLLPQVAYEDPNTAALVLREPPPGMMTYDDAAVLVGKNNAWVRRHIHYGNLEGSNGLVVRQSVIDYVLQKRARKDREYLLNMLATADATAEPAHA